MDTDRIDLGFNDDYIDHCDYVDYSEITVDKNNKNRNTLTAMQLNARGVLNKHDPLKTVLNDIKKDNRVDIVLLVETWLNKTTAKRFMIPGYKFLVPTGKIRKGAV